MSSVPASDNHWLSHRGVSKKSSPAEHEEAFRRLEEVGVKAMNTHGWRGSSTTSDAASSAGSSTQGSRKPTVREIGVTDKPYRR